MREPHVHIDDTGGVIRGVIKMKKTIVAVCVALAFVAGVAMAFAADSKVGYINVQRIVSESDIGKVAKQDVDKLRQEKQAEVNGSAAAINTLKTDIDTKKGAMQAKELQEKTLKLQDMVKEHKRLVADVNDELTRKDRELVADILRQADGVVKMVAKKGNYTIIIKDPNAVGYLDPAFDITDEVLKELNKK